MLVVPCGLWQCSTFEVQDKFTSGTMKYFVLFRTTYTTLLSIVCDGELKRMLMTGMTKGV